MLNKLKFSELTLEVDGWTQVSSQNSPTLALVVGCSIPMRILRVYSL